jgi:hypothetical protein
MGTFGKIFGAVAGAAVILLVIDKIAGGLVACQPEQLSCFSFLFPDQKCCLRRLGND